MKLHAKCLLHFGRVTMTAFAILLATCFAALSSRADIVDLGPADDYAVFNVGSASGTIFASNFGLSAGVVINGDVGQGFRSTWQSGSFGATLHGTLFTAVVNTFPGFVSGGSITGTPAIVTQSNAVMLATREDVINASAAAAALSPTQTFTTLTNGQIIKGTAGLNVIRVTGTVNFPASSVNSLILEGTPTSKFVFQFTGSAGTGMNILTMSRLTMTLTGGIQPDNIVWNLNGAGGRVEISTSSTIFGTVLAPLRTVTVTGSTIDGQIIGGGSPGGVTVNNLTISGVTTITLPPEATTPVGEPGALTMLGAGMVGFISVLRRKQRRSNLTARSS